MWKNGACCPMMNRPARVAAIHGLAGFGRSSLAVVIPTLSAMGIQVCPIPTAVLSTHTGGLGDVEYRDLTDYIRPCVEHYKRLGLEFEGIYSGFLSNASQADDMQAFIAAYPEALARTLERSGPQTTALLMDIRGLTGKFNGERSRPSGPPDADRL